MRNPCVLAGLFSVNSPAACYLTAALRVQGNCQAEPQLQLQQPPLQKLRPGQCVLVTDMDLWHVRYGQLWMHNLYLRHTASARDDAVALTTSTEESGRLWMTHMTMQGAGQYAAGIGALGLTAGGPTYVAGAPPRCYMLTAPTLRLASVPPCQPLCCACLRSLTCRRCLGGNIPGVAAVAYSHAPVATALGMPRSSAIYNSAQQLPTQRSRVGTRQMSTHDCEHAGTGCEFRHLGGSEQVVYVNGARVRIVNSTIAENTITDDSSSLIYTYFTDGAAWLQGVALVNNSVALPLEAGYSSDGFASDVPRDYYDSTDKAFVSAPARPAEANAFLGGNEAWFQDVLKVCPPPGRAPAAATPSVCCCLHAAAKAFVVYSVVQKHFRTSRCPYCALRPGIA